MREHEVPTHVQAEDKVLLWLTFPQIVAVVAVCALAYGAYRYFPVGPAEFRLAIAVLLGITCIVLTVGKVGGRGLPLVAADLLKFNLGARRYAGPASELLRSEAPTPEPAETGHNPVLQLMKGVGRVIRWPGGAAISRIRRTQPGDAIHSENGTPEPAEARPSPALPPIGIVLSGTVRAAGAALRRGSPPFRPHRWFGKRRHRGDGGDSRRGRDGEKGKNPRSRERGTRKPWRFSLALAATALAVLTIPAVALADGPWSEDAWRLEEIGYPPPEPVPGRRLYVEEINVTGTLAMVTVRAATDLKLDVRSYGGDSGRVLTFFVHDLMEQGETGRFGLSLDGPNPSFTFAWQDGLGQTGALALKRRQLPHPMPAVKGEICSLQLDTLGWAPGNLSGVIVSRCAGELAERVELPVSSGHHSLSVDAVLPAAVTGVTGTVRVSAGGSSASVPFVRGGETRFTLPVAAGETANEIAVDAALAASLNVPLPPVLDTTHHPARTDVHRRTVSLSCGEYSVSRTVAISVHHPEHVRAEVVQRNALSSTRTGTVAMTTSLASDAPYAALALPEPTPTPVKAEHLPLTDDENRELFNRDDRREFP